MAQGWIKLDRRIQSHWIWQEKEPFDSRSAWIDLILMASHRDTKFLLGREMVALSRGQFITSVRKLADWWGWSRKRVYNFLKLLETDGMIQKNSDTKKTAVTIVNYGIYQDRRDSKKTVERQRGDTAETRGSTIKNVKELRKNEKEGATAPDAPSGQMDEEEHRRLIEELRK